MDLWRLGRLGGDEKIQKNCGVSDEDRNRHYSWFRRGAAPFLV